ncbi:hypothetical protein F5I97DRAFT_2017525 [Phlebopus sp. FC_14]|nr:hypothetical protein F5I97DRAFT_2017525 [Phlebopus sp. FC_14]
MDHRSELFVPPLSRAPSARSFISWLRGNFGAPSSKPQRGRKRYIADLNELKANPEALSNTTLWSVKNVRSGDDEGTFELDLVESETSVKQSISLLVSGEFLYLDTSEYPFNHTFFGYSLETGRLDLHVARIIDKLTDKAACTLRDVVEFIVAELSRSDDSEDEKGEEEDQMDDIDFEDESFFQGVTSKRGIQLGRLKREFVEAKAAGYNPGIIWTGPSNFILSISIPVIDITKNIPPHALLAWDRHLLEPEQHLTLLIYGFFGVYPLLQSDGTFSREAEHAGASLKFKVGLTRQYKPSKECAMAAFRQFGSLEEEPEPSHSGSDVDDEDCIEVDMEPKIEGRETFTEEFQRMSLSSSLESLLEQYLLRLVQLRRKYRFGWAAAEMLSRRAEILQVDIHSIVSDTREMCQQADEEEKQLAASYKLFDDPLESAVDINLLKTSFSLLLRRLALCTRHCVVCHRKLDREYEALKPYVCDSNLCVFQYYSLNLGPSIEQDVCNNTETVDLLVSLAYIAAADGVLDDPLPRGMGLRVPPLPGVASDSDGLCEFDTLDLQQMRSTIRDLIDSLPSIVDMKKYLQKKAASTGNTKVKLTDMKPEVLPAAWCVASCTSHIQELTKEGDRARIPRLGPEFRQFRFMFGSPDKEAKFQNQLATQTRGQGNAEKYPTLFAFHGSSIKNWHSIIRHGLWWKSIAHGRAYGNGVYFAKDGSISLQSYAQASASRWKNSVLRPSTCTALAEIINLPSKFVSHNPYYVVSQTDWIMCRYLLVKCGDRDSSGSNEVKPTGIAQTSTSITISQYPRVPYIMQDPGRTATVFHSDVDIPQPSHHLNSLLEACMEVTTLICYDEEDRAIYGRPDEEPSLESKEGLMSQDTQPLKAIEEWNPDTEWLERNVVEMLPPPTDFSNAATAALQRELGAMMREQNIAQTKNELALLGWYMPPEYNGDNLYQWILEMHSFDPKLPLAKDMKARGVNSLVFEVRFPPTFPHAPPFFRIIRPRFLSFSQGGGGHVTIGGSICIDLLTSDGWLPSYSISALLLQIKLAISNVEPNPARLQANAWDTPYSPDEAFNGYTRAAAIHGWKVSNPGDIRKLVTSH